MLTYDFDIGDPAVDILEAKILFKSVVSDAKDIAKFLQHGS